MKIHISQFEVKIIDLDNGQASIIVNEVKEKTHNLSINLSYSPLWQLELWDLNNNTPRLFPDVDAILNYNGRIPADKDKLSVYTLNNSCLLLSWHVLPVLDTNMKANVTIRISF